MIRAWRWTFLIRHSEAVEQCGGPGLYKPMANRLRTSDSASNAVKVEEKVLKQFLNATLISTELSEFPLDELARHFLLYWISFEHHRCTARSLGFLTNNVYCSDESVIPINERGIVEYFRSYAVRDPALLARFCQTTIFDHILRASKIFYELRLDETEQVALMVLVLLRSVSIDCSEAKQGIARITRTILNGLEKHHAENYEDFALRFANIVEVIPLIETFKTHWDEMNVMFQLNGLTPVGPSDKPIYPCLPEFLRQRRRY
ncbi:hypothetical protein AAVH_41748 [Aphelenchoides avenae]|nr:hypothetical protein AAVH_41748 [Aphelenchus avenae]